MQTDHIRDFVESYLAAERESLAAEAGGRAAPAETAAARRRRLMHLRADYNDFCEYYFPHITRRGGRHTPCAPFHTEAARTILRNPNTKMAFLWPRGHAKSTHMDVIMPMWLMIQEPRAVNVMVLVGKSEDAAAAQLADLRHELERNARYIRDFGPQKSPGQWEAARFVTKAGVAFFAKGKGQSPRGMRYRGQRPDYIVLDDIDDDQECLNPARIRKLTDWVLEALFNTLDAARGRFIACGNLISKTSVLANLAGNQEVKVSMVTAVDQDGEPVWKAKWTREEADACRRFIGYRAWQKEYMNNPIAAGLTFREEWIRFAPPPPLHLFEALVCYCDPSFKSGPHNDYKAAKLWGRARLSVLTENGITPPGGGGPGPYVYYCLKSFVRQCGVGEMVRWHFQTYTELMAQIADAKRAPQVGFYMEANLIQDILMDSFRKAEAERGIRLPLIPDRRKKPDKLLRIEQVAPMWERGEVYYSETLRSDPDTRAGIEQTLAFERGGRAHDDAPDADEGALFILTRQSLRPRSLTAPRADIFDI